MMNRITVQQNKPEIIVRQGPVVVVQQRVVQVTVYSEELAMPTRFRKFSFTATQGQTHFILEALPITMIVVYINGVAQDEEIGDFTLTNRTIILSDGVDAGDHVFGVYQEVDA